MSSKRFKVKFTLDVEVEADDVSDAEHAAIYYIANYHIFPEFHSIEEIIPEEED